LSKDMFKRHVTTDERGNNNVWNYCAMHLITATQHTRGSMNGLIHQSITCF
jgi:hypothetical protein